MNDSWPAPSRCRMTLISIILRQNRCGSEVAIVSAVPDQMVRGLAPRQVDRHGFYS